MADPEKTEEKTKQTVPALVRTAKGIAEHASAVQDMQWDKDRKVFRDPVVSMMALFTYAKITSALLAEAEERIAKKQAALEKRIAEFETRLTTVEQWKAEAEAMTAEMVKDAEGLMAGGPEALISKIRDAMPPRPAIVEAEITSGVVETKALPAIATLPAAKPSKPVLTESRDTNGKKDGVA